ncbi:MULTISPECIES: three component ABC system middle component [Paraburkholderia]|jgi:hypothetical protein|uniref:DUF6521 family protein n=1 Tax=Paraburkholderia strydomiana TaxID=1245417 RepID=A0ABW9ES27_9BURK|nr:three component ABC system middle component [Paraburkholderia gardini]CAG4890835.1 hypothetical protein R69919_01048 [Paraburkholderia gardini]
MTSWHERTIEQRNLLNPAFCAVVLWHIALGYREEALSTESDEDGLPLELSFVGASLVLRGQTRSQLPSTIRTSLIAWLQDNPLERSAIARGVEILRPYVREAIIFGVHHGALITAGPSVAPIDSAKKKMTSYVKHAGPDVQDCARRGQFVGRWLQKNGTSATTLALLGLQP